MSEGFMRRCAIVLLDHEALARFVDLPNDMHVVSLNTNWQTSCVELMIEGDSLDPVLPGCMPPVLNFAEFNNRVKVPCWPCRLTHWLTPLQAERVIVTMFGVAEGAQTAERDDREPLSPDRDFCALALLRDSFDGEGYAENCESWLGEDHAERTPQKAER